MSIDEQFVVRRRNGVVNYTMERWNINKSSDLYGVTEWGGGYFFVAENGDMMVKIGRAS